MSNNRSFDRTLFISVFLLVIISITAIYSSTWSSVLKELYTKQIIWFISGSVLAYIIFKFSPRYLYDLAYPLYALLIIALISVALFGTVRLGARRWIFGFQPSEIGKLILLISLARYYSLPNINWKDRRFFANGLILTAAPFLLVFSQPDLGTSLVYIVIYLAVLLATGLPYFYFFNLICPIFFIVAGSLGPQVFVSALIVYAIFLFKFGSTRIASIFLIASNFLIGISTGVVWNHLKDYQKQRILTFVNPEAYARTGGWQIIQSKIAVGNGGLTGEGFKQGSQTQLEFLPEGHTDFIFSVIAEEWGLIGVLVLFSIFIVMIYRIMQTAGSISNRFYYLICLGIATIFIYQAVINIGMTIGIMPVTGIPLPFISYGGSSMIFNMLMIGIILSIRNHQRSF